jgi:hypothetical protein
MISRTNNGHNSQLCPPVTPFCRIQVRFPLRPGSADFLHICRTSASGGWWVMLKIVLVIVFFSIFETFEMTEQRNHGPALTQVFVVEFFNILNMRSNIII